MKSLEELNALDRPAEVSQDTPFNPDAFFAYYSAMPDAMKLLNQMAEENRRLREALRFYATQSVPGQLTTLANMDGGDTARKALSSEGV